MFKLFLMLLAFPAQALPRSEPSLCGDGIATGPATLSTTLPHCAPAPPLSKGAHPHG